MDDTNNPDSYTIGTNVGEGTDTTANVKAAADGAVGSNPTTAAKQGNTGPDITKVRVGTGALYTEDNINRVVETPARVVYSGSGSDCQDCLNQIQVGVAGSGVGLYARRENNVLLFNSLQVEGALTLRKENGTIVLGGSAAVPALDIVLTSKGDLSAYRNKFLAVNELGDGIAFVDAPASTGGASKFSELTDIPALGTNVGRYLTVNGTGTGVVWSTISNFDGKWGSLTGKPIFANVATSGAYGDLTGRPALFDGTWGSLTGKPVLSTFDGAYSSLTGKPTLTTKFSQLTDAPAFAGNAGKVLTVNSTADGLEWAAVSTGSTTWSSITGKPTFAPVATSGVYADLTGKPTLFSGAWADITNKPTFFDGTYAALTGKPALFDGTYASLSGKPTQITTLAQLTDVPARSTNGGKVLSINSAGTAYVWIDPGTGGGATKFSDLTDVAPYATNQSKYLRLNGTANALEFVNVTWTEILNRPSLANVATSGLYSDLTGKPTLSAVAGTGSYNDLGNKPTIPTKFTQLSDAPLTSGNAGRVLAVNSAETGFEWITPAAGGTGGGVTKFTGLSDVPSSYTGAGGKTLRVNSGATALEFVASTLLGHTDFPASYASQAGKGLRVNSGSTAIEFYTIPTPFDGTYASLSGKPTLATVATSGLYSDLTSRPTKITDFDAPAYSSANANKALVQNSTGTGLAWAAIPAAFSGAYGDLSGKPTKVSDFDVPAYSSANANKVLAQNSTGTGLVWVALPTGGGGATALSGLSDVTLTSPATGQVLAYNGTKWINAAPPTGTGGGSATTYTFEVGFNGSSQLSSVSNLPSGWTWNGVVTSNTTVTIVRNISGFFSSAIGLGQTVNGGTKFKHFAINGSSNITYDTTTPTSFDITFTSASAGNTVATGKTIVIVTL